VIRAVMLPGILVQKITTRQPTDDMIEVAIVSMEQAIEADGSALPDGSGSLERHPLPPPLSVRAAQDAARLAEAEAAAPASADPPLPGT
jgi:hypothetical protein